MKTAHVPRPAAFAVDLTELAVYLVLNGEPTRPIAEEDFMDEAYEQAAQMLRAVGLDENNLRLNAENA